MWKKVRWDEILGIILAITIIATIIAVARKSQTLEYVLLAGLIAVTTWYAYATIKIARATKQQADASVKMAEEMREQRYDTVRPVIDIQKEETPAARVSEGLAVLCEDISRGMPCILSNIGLGPAIDVCSFVQPLQGDRWCKNFGTLAIGDKTEPMNLSLNQEGERTTLITYYRDVYDRGFKSSREVRVVKEKGLELGPLKIVADEGDKRND